LEPFERDTCSILGGAALTHGVAELIGEGKRWVHHHGEPRAEDDDDLFGPLEITSCRTYR